MKMVLQTETTEESAAVGPVTKKQRYNPGWAEDRPWLRYDCEQEVMYRVWCRDYDRYREKSICKRLFFYESREYQKTRSFKAAQR